MHKAKLGQHFLTRPEIARWVAESVSISHEDTVLEIGPGHGILTRELLQVAHTVVAIEKDSALVTELQETFAKEIQDKKLILIHEDIRNFEPSHYTELKKGYTLIANIPYYITGFIIRLFLTSAHQPKAIAVLIQKEVAERIVAKDKKHSLLSLSVHAFGTPTLKKVVKAGAFSPPPKVDSAILAIENVSRSAFRSKEHEERFFSLIHAGFASKRKMLYKQIENLVVKDTFTICDIDQKARAEDLLLEQWLCLSSPTTSKSQ